MASAAVADYANAWDLLKAEPATAPGWILHDGVVISFGDLRIAPLRVLCDGNVERHDTTDWADSDDEDQVRQFADLLRRTLVTDRRGELQWHQARHHAHFRATRNLKARVVGREHGNRGRTVFGPHYAKAEPERVSYYHHAAVNLRFRRIDGRWFCQLGVDYCFTHDGKNESSFADGLLAAQKGTDRDPAVRAFRTAEQPRSAGNRRDLPLTREAVDELVCDHPDQQLPDPPHRRLNPPRTSCTPGQHRPLHRHRLHPRPHTILKPST